jgi:hypothetical protein
MKRATNNANARAEEFASSMRLEKLEGLVSSMADQLNQLTLMLREADQERAGRQKPSEQARDRVSAKTA